MKKSPRWALGLGGLFGAATVALLFVGGPSCSTAPTAFLVQGPGAFGNEPPSLTITNPVASLTVGRGAPFLISWRDDDRDSNATISFSLLNTDTTVSNRVTTLVEGLPENDSSGPDVHQVNTGLIPVGTYNLFGTISDEDTSLDVFARTVGANAQQVLITIVEEGGGPVTRPPQIAVTAPVVNLSVAQDDELTVTVQPVEVQPLAPLLPIPYDSDSNITIYIVLDLDSDPTNDDPANPDPAELILLRQQQVDLGVSASLSFTIPVDLATIPPRPDGQPYFIRATADDGTNPRVHQYAVGTINIVQLPAGIVDLFDVGRTVSGARFYGFNPGANTGSSVTRVGDFDRDGTDDFLFVAQFGNPQNVGPVGEAYLVYGLPGSRFGGAISTNSIGDTVQGVIFAAPPVRLGTFADNVVQPSGITDVAIVRDLSGDNRPELMFGLPLVLGAFDSTDYDPGDQDPTEFDPLFCYPDNLVNNITDAGDSAQFDSQFFAGGMAVMVNSQNREIGAQDGAPRLTSTLVDLELAGQRGNFILGTGGLDPIGAIFTRAHNSNVAAADAGNDPPEPGRISGARFIGGGFDFIGLLAFGFDSELARADLFGQQVGSIGDLNSDGLDEVIISSPRNERYVNDLFTLPPKGRGFSAHFFSTMIFGSIVVHPGQNYDRLTERDKNGDDGTSINPFIDQQFHGPVFGDCGNNGGPRHYDIPAGSFEIFAENINDRLGDGQSAGDFNFDRVDDILCGAPKNDRTISIRDSGAAYILYGRSIFGSIDLKNANDQILRSPMLRVRGLKTGDEIGSRQMGELDVNGDRLDDVFIASPTTDYGGVTRTTCAVDFNRDGVADQTDLREVSFQDCFLDFGPEVFSSDACKAFDYDNDRDIDDVDRCVFCCLSDECEPDEACVFGRTPNDCCANMVDNGFAAVIFGGRTIDGDRNIDQIGKSTSDLPGAIFFGSNRRDPECPDDPVRANRAGTDISSAGDFDHDGFGDILIAAPGEVRCDTAGRKRVGVVYLIFGGPHLSEDMPCEPVCGWALADPNNGVGTSALPGIVFLSPYVSGFPNEAPPVTVGRIGDINNDGFDDIFIGNPKADFIDLSFPQGPNAPGSDAAAGRRRNAGDAYIVYGHNNRNRLNP